MGFWGPIDKKSAFPLFIECTADPNADLVVVLRKAKMRCDLG